MLTCGCIYYLTVQLQFMDEPKKKFLVYLCDDKNPIFLKINSDSHNQRNEVILRKEKYIGLDHVSYLDCQTVITTVAEAEVIKQLKQEINLQRESLLHEDLKQVRVIINQMRTVSDRHKELISKAISEVVDGEISI